MKNKVKKRIDHYLGFDSDELFSYGDPVIFGGAVRDSIADMDIHDIDIITGPTTTNLMHNFLISKGFSFKEDLIGKDIQTIYSDIHIISEPLTYIKHDRVVQLIRPVGSPALMGNNVSRITGLGGSFTTMNTETNTEITFDQIASQLIENVDMSCCGLAYDGIDVYEKYPNAMIHAEHKVFIHNTNGIMNTDRYYRRKSKLENRGWVEITEVENRDILVDHILN